MKISNVSKLRKEDIADAPNWVGKLLSTINMFIEQIYTMSQNRVSFADNIQCKIKDVAVSSSKLPVTIKNELGQSPTGVMLIKLFQTNDVNKVNTNATSLEWKESTDGIMITSVPGLEPGVDYTIRLLMF